MFAFLNSFCRNRMHLWLVVSLVLLFFIAALAPQQLPVTLYKLVLITSAAWVAYWIDVSLFPYARPDEFLPKPFSMGGPSVPRMAVGDLVVADILNPLLLQAFALTMLRRALIISAAMIAVALGA